MPLNGVCNWYDSVGRIDQKKLRSVMDKENCRVGLKQEYLCENVCMYNSYFYGNKSFTERCSNVDSLAHFV